MPKWMAEVMVSRGGAAPCERGVGLGALGGVAPCGCGVVHEASGGSALCSRGGLRALCSGVVLCGGADGYGALGGSALCGAAHSFHGFAVASDCYFSVTVKIFHGVSFLQSDLLLSICRVLLQFLLDLSSQCFYKSSAILGLLQREVLLHPSDYSCDVGYLFFGILLPFYPCIVRVEQIMLLRSNGKLRGTNLLSPVTPTSRSTAQQLTSNWCHFRGDSRRSFPVRQAVSIPW
uniref:DUF3778 domain-containing protein n=1 Tax=Oryza nivara TaxID=4536 RepID=A0A0E0GEF1_ORYNI